MRSSVILLAVLAGGAWAADAPSGDTANANHLLVGKWTWTRTVNKCTEVYDYRPDGTMYGVSGAERSDNTYWLSAKPSDKGFYRFMGKMTRDYGGKDCGDAADDGTGSLYTAYIRFNPPGDMHVVCQQENMNNCFGPLRRLSD